MVAINVFVNDQGDWTEFIDADLVNANFEQAGRSTLVNNLRFGPNATVNQLDIFAKSTGALPTAAAPIQIAIPDSMGVTIRTRSAQYLSGASTIVMADGAGYWGRPSAAGTYEAYLYAIWDGTGIVWAMSLYPYHTTVPTTTTATDLNYFLLETSTTYSRSAGHYCICVGRVNYVYLTTNAPDHAIGDCLTIYKPEDFKVEHHNNILPTTISAATITDRSLMSQVVLWTGTYKVDIQAHYAGTPDAAATAAYFDLRVGATYSTATKLIHCLEQYSDGGRRRNFYKSCMFDFQAGDTVHFGGYLTNGALGTVYIFGQNDADGIGGTSFNMQLMDRKHGIWY